MKSVILTSIAVAALGLVIALPDPAAASCGRKDVNIDGSIEGSPFSAPARLFGEGGDNIGLSAEDCDSQKSLNRRADQGAAMGLVGDTWTEGPGLTLGLNGALVDESGAGSLFLAYQHDFDEGGWVDGMTFNVLGAYGADDRVGGKIGGSIYFGNLSLW